jgi:hypothetical protein
MSDEMYCLSEYLFEIGSEFNTFLPGITLESEEGHSFHYWRQLEEITRNNKLDETRGL